MGSPLGLVLANIFMYNFEEKWVLKNSARPSVWFRYVDDTFTLFDNKNKATQFLHYLNNCHANIKFTVEFEKNSTIPFLDILIKRHNHTFSTSISRRKTFTDLYTKWDSFTLRKYKVNLFRSLTIRCFRICHRLFWDLVLMNWGRCYKSNQSRVFPLLEMFCGSADENKQLSNQSVNLGSRDARPYYVAIIRLMRKRTILISIELQQSNRHVYAY